MAENRNVKKTERLLRAAIAIALLAAALAGFGCASGSAYRNGENDELLEQWDKAVSDYARARELSPRNLRYKNAFERAKRKSAQAHFEKGKMYNNSGRPELAVVELEQTVTLDPENDYAALELTRAREEIAAREKERAQPSRMEKLQSETRDARAVGPILQPASKKPISLNFPQPRPIKQIYQALGQAAGINVIFDPALKDDQSTIILTNVDFKTALETLLRQENHFYKVIDPHTILIAADTPNNRKTYEDLVIRTFYLSNGDVTEVANAIRALLGTVHVSINKAENAITLRDTADKISIAQRVIEQNDKEKGEVIVDVELLQLNLSKALNLGLLFPSSEKLTYNSPTSTANGTTTTQPFTVDLLRHLALNQFAFGTLPSIQLDFLKTYSDASVLAQPQLRISEGEKAQLTIGQRIPVPVTTFSSSFAGTGGQIAATPVTSFQYQQVGIKIEMEPRVHHNKEVTLKLTVEVSSNDGPAPGTTDQPIIGDRTISSTIRLKDGETNFLAGLIRRDKSVGTTGVPFLSDIPIIGEAFKDHTNSEAATDLVMTITPHIIRIPDITKDDLMPVFVGTESNISYQGAPRVEAFNEPPSPLDTQKKPGTQSGAPGKRGAPVTGVSSPTSSNPFFPQPSNPTQPSPTQPPQKKPFSQSQPISQAQPQSESPSPQPSADAASQPLSAEAAPPAAASPSTAAPAAASNTAPTAVAFNFAPASLALAPGDEGTVLLTVTGSNALAPGSVSFDYDPSVLQVESVEALAGSQSVPVSAGKIALTLSPDPTLLGTWPLAKVTVKALAPGSTSIAFGENSLTDLAGNPAAVSFGSVSVEVK